MAVLRDVDRKPSWHHLAKEVMHIARTNAGSSQSSDTRPRSAHLPAGAIPLRRSIAFDN
jgi:hypothetical protein